MIANKLIILLTCKAFTCLENLGNYTYVVCEDAGSMFWSKEQSFEEKLKRFSKNNQCQKLTVFS